MLILLKIKNNVVPSGYFIQETIMLVLLGLLPLLFFIFKKYLYERERNSIKYIAYFPIGLIIGMFIPVLNFFVMYFFIIPFLGYEKEKITETQHFRLEKVQDIISSGGQATFEVYKKENYFDRCIERFDASIYSKIGLKEIGYSYKIIIK